MADCDRQKIDPNESPLPRRTFFQWLTFAIGGAAAGLAGVPILGYFFRTPQLTTEWIDLGTIEEFPQNETRMITFDNPLQQPWDGMTAHTGVYVRYDGRDDRDRDQFLVLTVNCAHLGCPVSWFPQSGLFMCPCHGGVYYANGERASGPPPRGLFHCVWQVRNGRLKIQAPHYPTLQDTLQDSQQKPV
jgi:menaquinol-cytochrome c reductase iron-sulfur subunit